MHRFARFAKRSRSQSPPPTLLREHTAMKSYEEAFCVVLSSDAIKNIRNKDHLRMRWIASFKIYTEIDV